MNRTKIFSSLLLIYCIALVIYIFAHWKGYATQWDFTTYYYAHKTAEAGLNPYDSGDVLEVTPPCIVSLERFVYPPFTIPFFGIFALPDYQASAYLYLGVKLALLAALVLLWRTAFLKEKADPLFYIYCLLAFNSAIYLDLRAGNISIFLQSALWLGFFALLKKRTAAFCALVGLAALFKFQYLLFLSPLLFGGSRRKFYLSGTLLGVASIYAFSYIGNPELFRGYLANLGKLEMAGPFSNLSTLSLVVYIFDMSAGKGLPPVPAAVPVVIYGAISAVVIAVTARAMGRAEKENRERLALFILCAGFALVVPRIKDYSFILLLVPSYFALKNANIKAYPVLLILFMLSGRYITLPLYREFLGKIVWGYYPLLLGYASWLILVLAAGRHAEGADPLADLHPPS